MRSVSGSDAFTYAAAHCPCVEMVAVETDATFEAPLTCHVMRQHSLTQQLAFFEHMKYTFSPREPKSTLLFDDTGKYLRIPAANKQASARVG